MIPLDRVAVLSVSGRALASSARKCAQDVIVCDAFADQDTQALARTFQVNVPGQVSLSRRRILQAMRACELKPKNTTILIGSGLESSPNWLTRLAEFGQVLTQNSPSIDGRNVAALGSRGAHAGITVLQEFGWRVPDTVIERPTDPRGWLQKRINRSGGVHIRFAEGARHVNGAYYQRYVAGTPMSITFLASGAQVFVLGVNTLLTEAIGARRFCYAGVISGVELPHSTLGAITDRLKRMSQCFDWRGLCGLDFILSKDEPIALEINTRPTASFELYDDWVREGLVRWHVRCFQEGVTAFPERPPNAARCKGIRVMYAQHPLLVAEGIEFPEWACDIPRAGTSIPAGAPICSVRAWGDDASIVARELETRVDDMRGRFEMRAAQQGKGTMV